MSGKTFSDHVPQNSANAVANPREKSCRGVNSQKEKIEGCIGKMSGVHFSCPGRKLTISTTMGGGEAERVIFSKKFESLSKSQNRLNKKFEPPSQRLYHNFPKFSKFSKKMKILERLDIYRNIRMKRTTLIYMM
jgi:hypothetical protein